MSLTGICLGMKRFRAQETEMTVTDISTLVSAEQNFS